MARNQATDFFSYDDEYYNRLMTLPEGELVLHGVYQNEKMVSAVIGLLHGNYAFYHLGASTRESSRIGAGNLGLFNFATGLMKKNVSYLNVGGGRTTALDDALYRFKKSNGTSESEFYIGKRIIDQTAYENIRNKWQELNGKTVETVQLQFYR